jgi:dienelactone hydrolase
MNIYPDKFTNVLASENKRQFSFENCKDMNFKDWQNKLRTKLEEIIGLNEIASRTPINPNPQILEQKDMGDYTKAKMAITTESGVRIHFYLLKPKNVEGKLPLVITPHGHSKNGADNYIGIFHNEQEKQDIIEGQRDIALQAVKQGYIAIAPWMRGFGDLRLAEDKEADETYSDRKLQMRAILFGRTLIGERVWDMMKILDYALQRNDVDSNRIAITGNSGGATVSLFTAACDKRISIAAPCSYFCTFEHSIGSIRHCECNYLPKIMKFAELYDIAGLICPRPILIVSGKDDDIFPVKGVKTAFSELQKIYKAGEAAEDCKLYIGDGGHRYYSEPVWQFMKKQFMPSTT